MSVLKMYATQTSADSNSMYKADKVYINFLLQKYTILQIFKSRITANHTLLIAPAHLYMITGDSKRSSVIWTDHYFQECDF